MTANDEEAATCRVDVLIDESDLANQLSALTSSDIAANTHQPVTGLHHRLLVLQQRSREA